MDATAEVVSPLIQSRTRFVRRVVDTRNYFIHYDTTLRAKAAVAAGELSYLKSVLSFLVQGCFLRELGIPSERWSELFGRNDLYMHMVDTRDHVS